MVRLDSIFHLDALNPLPGFQVTEGFGIQSPPIWNAPLEGPQVNEIEMTFRPSPIQIAVV